MKEKLVTTVKVALVLVLAYAMLKACFSGGETYERPINGHYNNPNTDTYERARERQQNQPVDVAEEVGKTFGKVFRDLEENFRDFSAGARDGAAR